MRWARIENRRVMEFVGFDPEGRYHPDFIWVVCGEEVMQGYSYVGGVFSPPAEPVWSEENERAWRDAAISQTDYLAMPDYPLTVEARAELLAYRKALRDWPATPSFPTSSGRPKCPAWLPSP